VELDLDDQTLLILRVDRDGPAAAEARLVVTLRRRFERIEQTLRERMQAIR
jgi:hypothetical protein